MCAREGTDKSLTQGGRPGRANELNKRISLIARLNYVISQLDEGRWGLESGYELVSQKLNNKVSALVLNPIGQEDTFLDIMCADPKRREEAALITRSLIKIYENGLDYAVAAGLLKPLKGVKDVALFEAKAKRTVFRVMSYAAGKPDAKIVLLFDFRGHRQHASGGIPRATMDKGLELAKIARQLLEG